MACTQDKDSQQPQSRSIGRRHHAPMARVTLIIEKAAKKIPRNPARLRRNRASRPFAKMQIDLYEVSPQAEDGTQYVLTCHCTYGKYPFFRLQRTKTAKETAENIFDVILDAGVVPLVFQSDLGKEFANEMLGELLNLLGSAQVFSSAVHPQSQGLAHPALP